MAIWDPAQYLKFDDHRLRPALDLLARIPIAEARQIWDLGCGTGNVTALLAEKWPGARVTGLDSSPAMLAKARANAAIAWVDGDVTTWTAPSPVDLVFTNAVLHWVPDHARLLPRLLDQVRKGGVLAVQMPRQFDAPSHTLLDETALAGPWAERLKPLLGSAAVATPADYWRWLRPLAASLDVWEAEYLHVLSGDNAVVEWTKGTTARPLLDALDPAEKDEFLAAYGRRIAGAYPPEPDGRTLFPFRRLFIVALR